MDVGSARAAALALSVALVLAACSGARDEAAPAPTPRGFEVPAGVTLTRPGTVLALDEPATVVLELGDGAASAVTVAVTDVRRGDVEEDFRAFSLDAASRAATPYYVDVVVRNEGPAGLGDSSLPLLAHGDADVLRPASELVGAFEPCPSSALPGRFLRGASARLCFVYLLPAGERLRTVDLQPGGDDTAVRWDPSA